MRVDALEFGEIKFLVNFIEIINIRIVKTETNFQFDSTYPQLYEFRSLTN